MVFYYLRLPLLPPPPPPPLRIPPPLLLPPPEEEREPLKVEVLLERELLPNVPVLKEEREPEPTFPERTLTRRPSLIRRVPLLE